MVLGNAYILAERKREDAALKRRLQAIRSGKGKTLSTQPSSSKPKRASRPNVTLQKRMSSGGRSPLHPEFCEKENQQCEENVFDRHALKIMKTDTKVQKSMPKKVEEGQEVVSVQEICTNLAVPMMPVFMPSASHPGLESDPNVPYPCLDSDRSAESMTSSPRSCGSGEQLLCEWILRKDSISTCGQ